MDPLPVRMAKGHVYSSRCPVMAMILSSDEDFAAAVPDSWTSRSPCPDHPALQECPVRIF